MRLAPRLALTLVLTALPLTAGIVLVRERLERSEGVRVLAAWATARMEAGGREECEEEPEVFQDPPLFGPRGRPGMPPGALDDRPPPRGRDPRRRPGREMGGGPPGPGPGGRFELWAYNPDFRSDNPRAPEFPAALRADLERGAERADGAFQFAGRTGLPPRGGLQAGLRMPWEEGPAAIVLARRLDPVEGGPGAIDRYGVPALLAAALVAALFLAVLPTVRRVRALRGAVERSAASGYRERVEERGTDELAELGQAFNAAGARVRDQIDTLERRGRSLRAFVENTTHDVMIPLTVLQGHLSTLARRAARGEPAEVERLREAQEEAHYLGALLENLGAAARLEADELPLESHPFSLNRLVERVAARHAPIARGKGVELVHALPGEEVESLGDVTLFERALSNVVHNAVRYGVEGGHVAVVLELEGAAFVLRVIDDGPGVPEEELARLAQRSYRGEDARRRHPTGTGLGLSIAKEVCERLGFGFRLARGATAGLEVALTGPRHARPQQAARSESGAPAA